jgi:hypothetical protein
LPVLANLTFDFALHAAFTALLSWHQPNNLQTNTRLNGLPFAVAKPNSNSSFGTLW